MSKTILIIDESLLSIELIEKALIKRDKEDIVLYSTDNKSTLEKIKRYPIDIIIIDSSSAQKDEFEILREIAKFPSIRVVLTTNLAPMMNDYIRSLASVYALKIAKIIRKPIIANDVIDSITEVLKTDVIANEANNGIEHYDISLLYQPQFQISPKKITGFEILSRWADKEDKVFSRHAFLPLISKRQLNMKKAFNLTVINHFIEDYKNLLHTLPKDLSFSLNIDIQLLSDDELLSELKNIYAQKIKHCLVIEISGNDIDEPIEKPFLQNLNELKEVGFQISIDKFGYAPVNYPYIKMLPIDEVKIDRTVTNDFCSKKISSSEINQAIEITEEMKARVVFEGIETEEMADIITALDPNYRQQGFFHCVPVPPILLQQMVENK